MEAMYRECLEGGRIKGNAESERQKLGLAIEGWRDVGETDARKWG
jgi:hypothetical protein